MSSAAKVGIFMVIVLAILGFFILKIEDIRIGSASTTKNVDAIFDSVAGLNEKSTVRVAGVPVGKVLAINLRDDGRAQVTLEIDRNVELHQGASASVASLGLLGEKYIELDPGNLNAPVVSDALPITGSHPSSIDDVTSQVSAIATDVKAITASLRNAMGGPSGEQRVEEIVENVRQISARVRMILEVNEGNVNATAANLKKITDDLRVEIPKIAASIDRVANSIGGTVNENREDVRLIVENLKTLSSDLKTTATNLNSITGQVKSGEGSIGKLIYSGEAHDKLTKALASVDSGVTELKNTLGRANRIGLDVGIKGDYYAGLDEEPEEGFDGNSRSAISLNLIPNRELNRFFNIELSDDPRGKKRTKITQTTTTNDLTGESSTVTTRQVKFDRDFLVSAQAGWKYDQLALRLGLFDSTGGIGADYAFDDRLSVTGEAFDFSKRRDASLHLRLYGRYVFRKERPDAPALFLTTGVDNPFNDTAFTIGGGIRWSDDDLKYLLGSLPIP